MAKPDVGSFSHVLKGIYESTDRTNRYELKWKSAAHPEKNGSIRFRCTEQKLRESVMNKKLHEIAKKNKLSSIDDIIFRFGRID
jgi:hypothetical protein